LTIILDAALNDIKSASEISIMKNRAFDETGNKITADIIRFGKLSAVYRSEKNGNTGFAKYSTLSQNLYTLPLNLDWRVESKLGSLFAKNSEYYELPIDITNGKVFEQYKNRKTVIEHIKSGEMLVYPILAIGILALIIFVERMIFLNKFKKTETIAPAVIERINSQDWETALNSCKSNTGLGDRILAAAITHRNAPRESLENILQETVLKEMPALEKYLSTLSIFAAIAPPLGLLGTVTGMISTFDIITIFGAGNPKLMSGGISEALVTTELGLIVAIPILVLHNFLSNKVDNIISDLEQISVSALNLISRTTNKPKLQ